MWVRRGLKDYYYRSRRGGGGVERQYFGSGPEAHLAAALDAQRRRERQARRDALRADRGRWDSAAAVLSELAGVADLLARAALLGAGFHQHQRGAWRRRKRDD